MTSARSTHKECPEGRKGGFCSLTEPVYSERCKMGQKMLINIYDFLKNKGPTYCNLHKPVVYYCTESVVNKVPIEFDIHDETVFNIHWGRKPSVSD